MEKGNGDHEGKLQVIFRDHLRAVLRFAVKADTRKRVYVAHANRCNENIPLFREVVILRDEAARLLGYSCHAALVVENKMAQTSETVHSMLNTLQKGLMPGGLRELDKYRRLKEIDCVSQQGSWDGHYFLWDQYFYSRRLLQIVHSIDLDEIAEYIPLQTTIHGMMNIFGRLFSIEFVELTTYDMTSWHDDVQVFSACDVAERGGDFLGYLYLDLYSRGFKPTNPGNFPIVPVSWHLLSLGPA